VAAPLRVRLQWHGSDVQKPRDAHHGVTDAKHRAGCRRPRDSVAEGLPYGLDGDEGTAASTQGQGLPRPWQWRTSDSWARLD
jgi:hypothetical protein